MGWRQAVDEYLSKLKLQGRDPKTLENYKYHLQTFGDWFKADTGQIIEIDGITTLDIAEYRRYLESQGRKPGTINAGLRQLKRFLGWCVEMGQARSNAAADVRLAAEQELGPLWLSSQDVRTLLRAIKNPKHQLLVLMMLFTGMRVHEVVQLRVWYITELEDGGISIRGKGNKTRWIPLPNKSSSQLLRIINRYIEEKSLQPNDWLFPGQTGHISIRAVQDALKRYSRNTGVLATPHTLRHTFCKRLLNAKRDLTEIAALAGHETLNTTMRYTKPSRKELKDAIGSLDWL